MKKLRFIICCALSAFVATGAYAQTELIEPYAGVGSTTGGFGGDGAQATAAQLNFNYFIALDPSGNVVFTDNGNSRVRRIDASTHIITTIAGTTTSGFSADNVAATTSKLNGPVGIAIDASGNIFIGDDVNNRIRRVDAITGIITTVAGNGTAGTSPDGTVATAAMITTPRGVAVSTTGDLYFSEGNVTGSTCRVRMVSASTGLIKTVAGTAATGTGADGIAATASTLKNPRGVTVDGVGNLYIADMGNNRIQRVDVTTGLVSTVAGLAAGTAGTGTDGVAATLCSLNAPTDMKFDGLGNMYIADVSNGRIRMVNTSGVISTVAGNVTGTAAGNWGPATASAVRIDGPVSIAIEPNNHYFYISDRVYSQIRLVRPNSIPYFTGGTPQSLVVCENTTATSISSLLSIVDSDQTQTETWTVTSGPANGSIAVGSTVTSTGGTVTPTGFTYTPTAGFSGTDAFTIQVSDGYNTATTVINVTVNPLPTVAAISGSVSAVCLGANIVLTDATSGGTWTTTTGNAGVVGGTVSGVTVGTDVISYTLTNSCGPTSMTYPVTVNPLPNAGTITGSASVVCVGSNITLADVATGGSWSSAIGNASVTGGTVTGSSAGADVISYIVSNSCGTANSTYPVTVNPLPNAGTITGSFTSVCQTANIVLTDVATGGSWSAANTNASVVSGTVTGATTGTDVISYIVTNSCGTANATYPVTVNPAPNAGTITGFTSVCVAGNITLADTAPGGSWSASNSNASVVGGTVTGNTTGTDPVSYSVTNGCGTAVATVTVNVVSSPDAGAISGTPTVCQGGTTVLSETVPGGSWTTLNANAAVVGGVVSGVAGGTDIVSYTVTFSCGTAFAIYPVTINPLPTPAAILGIPSICEGSTSTFTDPTGLGVWSVTNANASITSAGAVTGITGGLDTVVYSVTNACGTVAATKTVTVNANVIPFVSFTASPGFTTCPGTLVTYSATPVNGGTTPTYLWAVNGVAMGSSASFVHTPVNGDAILCVLTSSVPCVVIRDAGDTVVVTVNPTLAPAVSISTGIVGDTVCVGTSTTFMASPVNGGSTPSYTWSVNSSTVATGSSYTYVPANGDIISAQITSSYACPSPSTATSNTITMTVNTTEVPALTITENPGSPVCQGTIVTFTAHPVYGGIPPFFRWTQNGINVATGPNYTYVPDNGDIVYCMMASSSVCRTLDSVFSNVINMTTQTDAPIAVTIHASGDSLIAIATASITTLTYQWYVNGSAVTGATSPAFFLTSGTAGTAIVNCVVNSGDVCNTSAVSNYLSVTVSGTGVMQLASGNSGIKLLPNPNKGTFTINLNTVNNEDAQVVITNILGDKVSSFPAATNKDVAVTLNQPAGIYFVTATTSTGKNVVKVVVE